FDGMLAFYKRGLTAALRRRFAVLMGSLVVLVATVVLFEIVPKGFIPQEDQGQIFITLGAAQGISLQELMRHELERMRIVGATPNVATYFARVGAGRGSGNSGFISIRTLTKSERKDSIDDIVAQLRPKLDAIPGVRVYLQIPPPINIGGR